MKTGVFNETARLRAGSLEPGAKSGLRAARRTVHAILTCDLAIVEFDA